MAYEIQLKGSAAEVVDADIIRIRLTPPSDERQSELNPSMFTQLKAS